MNSREPSGSVFPLRGKRDLGPARGILRGVVVGTLTWLVLLGAFLMWVF